MRIDATSLWLTASLTLLGACGGGGGGGGGSGDSGVVDSGVADTGESDSSMGDSGMTDSGMGDSGMTDSGVDSGVDSAVPTRASSVYFNASGGGSLTGSGMRLELTIGAPVPAGHSATPGGNDLHLGGQSIR